MKVSIRLEKKEDYRAVENLTREAFWNIYGPGCDEHLMVHQLRKSEAYVDVLDFVSVSSNDIIGHIIYSKADVMTASGQVIHGLTFGPVSVLPKYQDMGIGSELIRFSLKKAKQYGYPFVIIFGDPKYYKRFGFKPASSFNIQTEKGESFDAFMALELIEDTFKGISGTFKTHYDFKVSKKALEGFDKLFPYKEKTLKITEEKG